MLWLLLVCLAASPTLWSGEPYAAALFGRGLALPPPGEVRLGGVQGEALERGVARLAQDPYSADWLLADVSFKVSRIFTNYSGDVSGRFLELATLTSPPGRLSPATLPEALASIARYQKPDGHFGVDLDLKQPLLRNSAPIPMLWGNARLLVGLVTAAQQLHEPKLLAAARRLGDFYVNSSGQLCSTNRETEYRASGSGGDGYTCCYFPAIEGLTMLYRATQDRRYLRQAEQIAQMFWKFDALPIDHSHGNLCAWRGILELYDLTGNHEYLERARAKWEAATQGGYVWPLGGVGEHWYVSFNGDEGCSESDWLRFNLELWRRTGQTKYLDLAERLLENQYAANQTANGGFGFRHLDGQAAGPVSTDGTVEEWPFCCSFHGPLGLHFLKGYLAAGWEHSIFVNFPLTFSAPVAAGDGQWRVAVKTDSELMKGRVAVHLTLAPRGNSRANPVTLWLRMPSWASSARLAGSAEPLSVQHGYVAVQRECRAGDYTVVFDAGLSLEARRFQSVHVQPGAITRLADVSLLAGPKLLFASPATIGSLATLLAMGDDSGRLELLRDGADGWASVILPNTAVDTSQILAALDSAKTVKLQPWSPALNRRSAFAFNVVVVPAKSIPPAARARFAQRAPQAGQGRLTPCFGTRLETSPENWQAPDGWQFAADGLQVWGGDVGLIDGEGYRDYRFEFDLLLSEQSQGITGWVVRAANINDLVMFQLQTADSPFQAPEFKTKPNTLRPHLRRNGAWTVSDPVSLPKEIRRGQTHRIAVECRGEVIDVFLDGAKIHTQSDQGLHSGAVGFRANGPTEQRHFSNVSVTRLP